MHGIYAIADLGALDRARLEPVRFVQAVLAGGVAALQLRGKRALGGRLLELLRAVAPLARERGVPLFANDRADLALMAGCDGLHVGQGDTPVAEVRALAAKVGVSLVVGLSTHDESQLERALAEPVDYLAVGPVFGTVSKENPDPVLGLDRAVALAKHARSARPGLPLVAIGGVGPEAAARLAHAFDAVAVISALLPERSDFGEVESRAKALVQAFAEASRAAPAGRSSSELP